MESHLEGWTRGRHLERQPCVEPLPNDSHPRLPLLPLHRGSSRGKPAACPRDPHRVSSSSPGHARGPSTSWRLLLFLSTCFLPRSRASQSFAASFRLGCLSGHLPARLPVRPCCSVMPTRTQMDGLVPASQPAPEPTDRPAILVRRVLKRHRTPHAHAMRKWQQGATRTSEPSIGRGVMPANVQWCHGPAAGFPAQAPGDSPPSSEYNGLLSLFPLCRYIGMQFSTTLSKFSRFGPWAACPAHARPAASAPRNSSFSSWLAGCQLSPKVRVLAIYKRRLLIGPLSRVSRVSVAKATRLYSLLEDRDAVVGRTGSRRSSLFVSSGACISYVTRPLSFFQVTHLLLPPHQKPALKFVDYLLSWHSSLKNSCCALEPSLLPSSAPWSWIIPFGNSRFAILPTCHCS